MSPAELEQRIFLLRGRRVMLSTHLAGMYGVEVRALVQAVKRNVERFPEDFMFQLTAEELDSLRSQIVILDAGRGQHSKYLPYAFTQEGVAMLSSVLRSSRAVQVNIGIMRAFVRIREMLGAHRDLQARLNELERKYDAQFKVVFDAIRQITAPAAPSRKQIGYVPNERKRPGAK